jgi:hypothetical protein
MHREDSLALADASAMDGRVKLGHDGVGCGAPPSTASLSRRHAAATDPVNGGGKTRAEQTIALSSADNLSEKLPPPSLEIRIHVLYVFSMNVYRTMEHFALL